MNSSERYIQYNTYHSFQSSIIWGPLQEKKANKKAKSKSDSKEDAIEREMKMYLEMDILDDLEIEPLKWWYIHGKTQFPHLFLVAKKVNDILD